MVSSTAASSGASPDCSYGFPPQRRPCSSLSPLLPLHRSHVLLREPLAHALLPGHRLQHAPADAPGLARRQRLGCEVVDAGDEAVVD
jgi:hypothetical protein